MSQLNNLMKMKVFLEKTLSDNYNFANQKLLENELHFNNKKIFEFKEKSILVDILGIKKYSDMTIEDLQLLVNTITFKLTKDENSIPKLKQYLLKIINEFVSIEELYVKFSENFNIKQSINAVVLSNKIIAIFKNHIHVINSKNSFEIKYFNELDLLTLAAIYDIIHNFMDNIK